MRPLGASLILGLCLLATAARSDGDVSPVATEGCAAPVGAWTRTYPRDSGLSFSDLAVAPDRIIYITGDFDGPLDFDPSEGVDLRESNDDSIDVLLTKLRPDGSYAWTLTFGGPGQDGGRGVAVSPDGHIWVAGSLESSVDFDPGEGVDERTSLGENDAFVTRFTADGDYEGTWVFAAGLDVADASGLAIDGGGNVIAVGSFRGSADFDPGEDVDLRVSTPIFTKDSLDAFVTKLGPDGSYLWTRTLGGSGLDHGFFAQVDADDNVFVYGSFSAQADFDPSEGVDIQIAQVPDALFVTKFFPDGSYAWTRVLQDLTRTVYDPIEVDANGDIWVVGAFRNFVGAVDFDPTPGGVDERFTVGPTDVYVSKWHNDGSYAWTRTFTGDGFGAGVAVEPDGGVVVIGSFQSVPMDFDPGPGVVEFTSAGADDVFITKLGANGDWVWTRTIGGPNNTAGDFLEPSPDGGLVLSGVFSQMADFDPGCAVDQREDMSSALEQFVSKLVCVEPTPDLDADGDVDLLDLARFQNCFSGTAPTTCPSGCYELDFDGDDDIDLSDFGAFSLLLPGP